MKKLAAFVMCMLSTSAFAETAVIHGNVGATSSCNIQNLTDGMFELLNPTRLSTHAIGGIPVTMDVVASDDSFKVFGGLDISVNYTGPGVLPPYSQSPDFKIVGGPNAGTTISTDGYVDGIYGRSAPIFAGTHNLEMDMDIISFQGDAFPEGTYRGEFTVLCAPQ